MTSALPSLGSIVRGKYRVQRLLGEGGAGAVFARESTVTGKRVAFKCMRSETAHNPDAVQRFLREAHASARVRHPNVEDVYDVINDSDAIFLARELLEGETRSELMKLEGVPLPRLVSVLIHAMRGITAPRRQGIIQR
jgi:eukaryotic-like serine/threonine-protein kinase